MDIQREEFKRLGVFGVWENPYLTMRPAYEAATARELGNFMGNGAVFRGKKTDPLVFYPARRLCRGRSGIRGPYFAFHLRPFPFAGSQTDRRFCQSDSENCLYRHLDDHAVDAAGQHGRGRASEFTYVLLQHEESQYILAEDLVENFIKVSGMEGTTVLEKVSGDKLENLQAQHPFYDRKSPVVLADYVTLETGTGCVHTAPGHGRDDYETGLKYGLEVLSPLNDAGEFLPSVEFFAGMRVWDANPKVIALLKERGHLVAERKITHSYPHCWRCKEPVIFRATTQWFISMETNELRAKALNAIDSSVTWIPSWGKERIHNMIAMRPDWCISRQRFLGRPHSGAALRRL